MANDFDSTNARTGWAPNDPRSLVHATPGKTTQVVQLMRSMHAASARMSYASAMPAIDPSINVQRGADESGSARALMDLASGGTGAAVQMRADATSGVSEPAAIHDVAAAGVSGAGGEFSHADTIASAFGEQHASTVRGINAHTDSAARSAASSIGARAYATGNDVALDANAEHDLHTQAHEAAHVVQQKAGVSFYGGVGEAGDQYEQHADAVADRVVAGRSAADLLENNSGTASTSQVQRKEIEPSATAGMPLDNSLDHQTLGVMSRASVHADAFLARVRGGQLGADAACLQLASEARLAVDALERYATARLGRAATEDADEGAVRVELERKIDVFVAASLRLVGMARSESPTGAGAIGAPTLATLMQTLLVLAPSAGFRIPGTVDEMDARVAAQTACPDGSMMEGRPGCALSDGARREHRSTIRTQLGKAGRAFFEECKTESAALEAAIEKDAKWGEILSDALIGALIAMGAAAVGAAAEGGAGIGAAADAAPAVVSSGGASEGRALSQAVQTYGRTAEKAATVVIADAAGEGAKEGSRGLDFFKDSLKDIAKASANTLSPIGALAASGDPRLGTISVIERLAEDVLHALDVFADGGLEELTDDALEQLWGNLFGAGATEPYARAARTFIAQFRQQVEPINTVDYKDPRMWGIDMTDIVNYKKVAGTRAVYVVGADPVPQLAVVKEVGRTTWNTMTGEMPPSAAVDAASYDFIAWVAPQFIAQLAPEAETTVSADKINGLTRPPARSPAP